MNFDSDFQRISANKYLEFTLLIFRIALGINMLRMAYILFRGGWDQFPNAGHLIPTVVRGPLGSILQGMYGDPVPIYLLALGAAFVGITLITGFLVRLGAYAGIFMAITLYLSSFPPEQGWINVHILCILAFFSIATSGTGYWLGFDKYLESLEGKYPLLRYFAG